MNQFYIVYKTTNLVNGKIYIGAHTTRNLDDGYMGSGHAIQAAIKKYGVDNFRREILFHAFDKASLYYAERFYFVTPEYVSQSNNYNLIKGGYNPKPLISDRCIWSTNIADPSDIVQHPNISSAISFCTKLKLSSSNCENISAGILRNLRMSSKSYLGRVWSWDVPPVRPKYNPPIYCYTISGDLVGAYSNVKDACKSLLQSSESCATLMYTKFINDDTFEYRGYVWSKLPSFTEPSRKLRGVRITCTTTNETFPTIKSAAERFNVEPQRIRECVAKGYSVKYRGSKHYFIKADC